MFYFKHDGIILDLDQNVISCVGLVELLKKEIKRKYPVVKSFGLSIINDDTFEIQVSINPEMNWKL